MRINNLSDSKFKKIVNLKIPWALWVFGCILRKRVNVSRMIISKLLTPACSLNSKGDAETV